MISYMQDPDKMTAEERIQEIISIFANAIIKQIEKEEKTQKKNYKR